MDNLQLPHKLTLNDRSKLTLTGVIEVTGFDDTTVMLHTGLGDLEIQGRDLNLKALSTDGGQLEVLGQVDAMLYHESRQAESFWQRLRR